MTLYAPFRDLAVPGSARLYGNLSVSVSGTLNDWTPTGGGNAFLIALAPTAATTITGMAPALDGTFKLVSHSGTTDYPVTLPSLDGGSSSSYQFEHGDQGSLQLQKDDCCLYQYRTAAAKWVLAARKSSAQDQVRRPSFATRTEASWWKVPGSVSRSRRGLFEPEVLDGTAVDADDATGPYMTLSTGALAYPGDDSGAAGIRTGARLFQPRWNVRAGWNRVAIPTALSDTRAWWGCFALTHTYGLSSLAGVECSAFRFDSGVHGTLLYAVTSDGSTTETTQLTTSAPQTSANYMIHMQAARHRFYINDSLVADHTTTLPAGATPLGHSATTEVLADAVGVRRIGWSRSWYTFGGTQ